MHSLQTTVRKYLFAARALLFLVASAAVAACATAGSGAPGKAPVPQTSKHLLREAEALARVGETIRAEQYFSAALDMGASADEVLPKLVGVCVRAGRFRSAVGYATPYLRRQPNNVNLRYLMAALYAGLGESSRASQELVRVFAQVPHHTAALRLASELEQERGDDVSAAKHLQAYLSLAPKSAEWSLAKEELQQIEQRRQSLSAASQATQSVPVEAL